MKSSSRNFHARISNLGVVLLAILGAFLLTETGVGNPLNNPLVKPTIVINPPGAIYVDDGDANNNDVYDLDDPGPIYGLDPALTPVSFSINYATGPEDYQTGITIVSAPPGCRAWLDPYKETPLPTEYANESFDPPTAFYLEGLNPTTPRGVPITVTWVSADGLNATTSQTLETGIFQANLEVDSLNVGDGPSGSAAEDQIEYSVNPQNPGKLIVENPNFASDITGLANAPVANAPHLVPMTIEAKTPAFDPTQATFNLTYPQSNPNLTTAGGNITQTVNGTTTTYTLGSGGLRIWKSNSATHDPRSVLNGGDFIPSGVDIPMSVLAGNPATVYLEYVDVPGASGGKESINLIIKQNIPAGVDPIKDPAYSVSAIDNVNVTLLPVQISTVSFDGDKYWQLESDDAGTQYSAPQWFSINGDPMASATGEYNYAIAYTQNSKPKIGATFKIVGASKCPSIKFMATGPDGITIPATAGTVGSDGETVTMPITESSTAFQQNVIKYYNKSDGTAFTLTWQLSVNGGATWCPIGTTKHTVYVTLGDPLTSLRQETVFYLGCENQGTQSDPKAVVNTIFSEFTSLNVCRVGTTTGMSYWGTWASSSAAQTANPSCFDAEGLLKMGDGRCGAWANLLCDIIAAQGISGAQVETDNPNNITSAGLTGADIMVNNWNLSNISDPIKLPGVAGQSNPNPQAVFSAPGAHALVSFSGILYDPSYGNKYTQATMSANLQAWEDASLAAVILVDSGGNQYIQPHVAGVQQTSITP